MSATFSATLFMPDEAATTAFGARISGLLTAGDCLLLTGQIGAGKSHFARAIIQALIGPQDVPSPTYTIVQTYQANDFEIWHADLYRLGDLSELAELGLEEAFETQLSIVEWADRLGDATPDRALNIAISDEKEGRRFDLSSSNPRWQKVLAALDA